MTHNEQLSSRNKKSNDNEDDDKLWEALKIDFRLEAFQFPDNKIYGIINIEPESSRKLIKKFILVVNKVNRIEFDPHYIHLSASGFDTKKKNPSAYIEAIPYNAKWAKEIKTSQICNFFFTGKVFALSPTLSFDWSSNETNPKPKLAKLVIKWYHIGDEHAHRYILYLDDIDIQHIRQKIIDDAFDVRILGFQPGKKHTFQLAARLNNGKETYRSDLMEFTVPTQEPTNEDSTELITVSNDVIPVNIPAIIATKEDKIEEEFNANKPKEERNANKQKEELNANKQKEDFNANKQKDLAQDKNKLLKQKPNDEVYRCCNQMPHDTFPGIEHYFKNISTKLPSSQNRLLNNEKKRISSPDDDDDVITSKN